MPVHDWTRVEAGIFHHFHHEWISEVQRAINRELKGTEYYALAEQVVGSTGPDVLTLQRPLKVPASMRTPRGPSRKNGTALMTVKPKLRFHIKDGKKWYTERKKAVTVRHISEHRIVAVFEIVSPGNKSSRSGIAAFIRKTQDLLSIGLHLAFADLFPPSARDPQGLHPLIWGDDEGDDFRFHRSKPLTCASYIGGVAAEAFVEPFAVGDKLATLPLFLTTQEYVPVNLEATYQAAFEAVPDVWQEALVASAK